MKNFLIWVAVSISSLFGIHSQPVTTPLATSDSLPAQAAQTHVSQSGEEAVSPVVSLNRNINNPSTVNLQKESSEVNSQPSAIAAKDIICPGGIPCPNQGAIKVSLSNNTWKVGNTYRVSWTNSLPKTSNDFYYVMIGVGTSSPRFPNGGEAGFYKVDGSKNYLDISFDSKTAEMRVLNSVSRNYDAVKNSFFVEVEAMDTNGTDFPQDDKAVAVSDSPLISVQGYTGNTYPISPRVSTSPDISATTLAQAQATGKYARIQLDLNLLRAMAELANASQTSQIFSTFCKNGLINTSVYKDLPALVQDIVTTQGVSDQAHAGLVCVSDSSKYVLGLTLTSQTAKPGVTSLCLDSSGNAGDNNKFTLNPSTISCQAK